VSRRPGERYHHRFIAPTFCSGRTTLMVWAEIAQDFKTCLFWVRLAPRRMVRGQWIRAEGLNGQRYADQIIRGPLANARRSLAHRHGGEAFLSVEDNAPAH
ncbi:hypothetical protein IE53DRAFT_303343, partial [Violaceomyces palustris]